MVYICVEDQRTYRGCFARREDAEASWRISHSKLPYKLRFVPKEGSPQDTLVQSESAGFGWVLVGKILEVKPLEAPEHL